MKLKKRVDIFWVLITIQILISLFFVFKQLQLDFWNDEIYSLIHFVFVPFKTIVTDYHVPNNHIFSNLILSIIFKSCGLSNTFQLMDYMFFARIIPLIYSILTIVYLYKIGVTFYTKQIAYFAAFFLLSSIVFINSIAQLRAYPLSTFLLTLIIYTLLKYLNTPRSVLWLEIIIFSILLVYSCPSNLYFIIAIISVLIVRLVNDLASEFNDNRGILLFKNVDIKAAIAIFLGLGFAMLCYMPIYNQVFDNIYVKTFKFDFNYFLSKSTWFNIVEFIYFRPITIVIAILGLYLIFFTKNVASRNKKTVIFIIVFIVSTYLVGFVRCDRPPDRVFIPLISIISFFLAILTVEIINSLPKITKYAPQIYICFVFIIINCEFIYGSIKVERIIKASLYDCNRQQSNMFNYYQYCFHPNNIAKTMVEIYQKEKPVIIFTQGEYHDLPHYLEKYNVPFHYETYLDSLIINKSPIYILANCQKTMEDVLNAKYSSIQFVKVNHELSYHNVFKILHIGSKRK